jgi:NADH-quinone oxidoreductase subunit J
MNLIINILSLNIILCLFLVNTSSNRIHSILYLISIYSSTSLIFMNIGLQIVGLFYFIVYVGAIAMLFLFSIMILDVKIELKTFNFIDQFNIIIVIFYLFYVFIEDMLYVFFYNNQFEYYFFVDNTLEIIGLILFDNYSLVFFLSALILFIALIGSIMLTNRKFGYYIKKQKNEIITDELLRNKFIYYVK